MSTLPLAKTQTIQATKGKTDLVISLEKWEDSTPLVYTLELVEPDSVLNLKIVLVPHGSEFRQIMINVIHKAPRTSSYTTIKSVHKGVSNCKISMLLHVSKNSMDSSANLDHQALMLSDKANLITIPSTECLNNLSVCNHAASIQAPDPKIIRYLLSRGFHNNKARKIVQCIAPGKLDR